MFVSVAHMARLLALPGSIASLVARAFVASEVPEGVWHHALLVWVRAVLRRRGVAGFEHANAGFLPLIILPQIKAFQPVRAGDGAAISRLRRANVPARAGHVVVAGRFGL